MTGEAGLGIEVETGVRTTGELTALIVPDTLRAPVLVLIFALELTFAFGRRSPLLFGTLDLYGDTGRGLGDVRWERSTLATTCFPVSRLASISRRTLAFRVVVVSIVHAGREGELCS